ncbi:hypothetical protein E4U41_002821 [Claviceps citrina]|nr:hypothetical protein E4U41_002821 [Claviceps citrina]
MYRATLRATSRQARTGLRSPTWRSAPTRRLASTASHADRPRSWKSTALRWGLAVAAIYYYNTSHVFAEDVAGQVESVVEQKRRQLRSTRSEVEQPKEEEEQPNASDDEPREAAPSATSETEPGAVSQPTEEEAGQQAAFNPETGEINWDCPCLGGMAHGPCGDEFKTAFSCFVYSNEEPKGMDCIDKFQGMQECFRKYPDIYGAELADDEEGEDRAPAEEPALDPSTVDTATVDTPKADTPKADTPKADTPKADTPEIEKPEQDQQVDAHGAQKQREDATDAHTEDAQKEQREVKESKKKTT